MAKELLLTSEKSGQQYNVLMTDLHTGTTIKTYKDDSSSPHSLCILNGEYIISAINNKPLIYSWSVDSKDRAKSKLIAPGLVTALTISGDGNFLVAAISEKIYVWQTASGDLLSVLSQHHQPVRTIKFTDDNGYLISTGDDNLIIVWELDEIVQRNRFSNSVVETKYVWTGHSLPITDFHCSIGGVCGRISSVSLDHTCKIWDLSTGQCTATFVFKHPITSVAMDTTEMHLFLGFVNGQIQKINICEKPLHEVAASLDAVTLLGHNQAVRCLSTSLDGSLLISGSDDWNIMVWDIVSGQCIRTIPHKGAITNLLVTMTPKRMMTPNRYPSPLMPLKKHLTSDSDDIIQIGGTEGEETTETGPTSEELIEYIDKARKSDNSQIEAMQTMQEEMLQLKNVCQKMYEKAVNEIIEQN